MMEPEYDSGTIDKVTDARTNCPHAEGGQRRMTTANIRAPKKEKIKGERNNEGRFAGFLAEACYFVELDGEAPEGVRKDISDGLIQVVILVIRPFVDTALHEQFAVISQGLQHPVLRLQLGAPNLRVVGAGKDDLDFVYSLESEYRPLL